MDTAKGGLNLRATPSQNAKVLLVIPENGVFTVLTYGTTWCYVWYNGTYGYVMTKFLQISGPTSTPEPTPTPSPTPTPAPIVPLTGNQARVTTADGGLNMRKGPSTQEPRVALIPRGDVVEVLTYGPKWCYVRYNGLTGYVMTKFLTLSPDISIITVTPTPTPAAKQYAKVTTSDGGLNMRNGTSTKSPRILIIPRNAYVQVLTYGTEWCYVQYNGVYGFVMTKFLTLV